MIRAMRRASINSLTFIRNATARYVGGVLLLLSVGVAGQLAVSRGFHVLGIPEGIISNLSEAFLVSGIIAALVDPYMKRRMQDDTAWGAIFGYLNPSAPKGLRTVIQEIASTRRYSIKSLWTAHFSWLDESKSVLALKLEAVSTEINLDVEPYRPTGRAWVLASIHGHQTEYLHYSLTCPQHFDSVHLSGGELEPYVVVQDDRSIYIETNRLVGSRCVPSNAVFETTRTARMYRHASGYVPLHHGRYIEELSVCLTGPALADLDVIISRPSERTHTAPSEWQRPASAVVTPFREILGHVAPGQVTLLSWGPAKRPHPEIGRTAEAQGLSHN